MTDLTLVPSEPGPPKYPRLQKLRDSHHIIAKMIACGLRPGQVVEASGYSEMRIWTLRQDPMFQNLVEHYRKQTLDVIEQEVLRGPIQAAIGLAQSNMLRSAQQLSDHLSEAEESGELLPVKELLGIFEASSDRVGFGKHSYTGNTMDFADRLDAAIRRSRESKDNTA